MDEPLDPDVIDAVLGATGAGRIARAELVQELWSGYGRILRCHIEAADVSSVIVKHVRWPDERDHPRGWATDRSHERKVHSYRVETHWYAHHAPRCGPRSRVPACRARQARPDGMLLVLEDLDAAGFGGRRHRVEAHDLDACLTWLAEFHATFLHERPDGIWPTGTYWHLATRPDELETMGDTALRAGAAEIDRRLSAARFQTFVHGDAKLANFCFADDGGSAAAVDFQYVGGGCGMKDLAYFVASCFDETECERVVPQVLDRYFDQLRSALAVRRPTVDADALEGEWRAMFAFAWVDFVRFLHGWSPGHWKLHAYSARLEAAVLGSLDDGVTA